MEKSETIDYWEKEGLGKYFANYKSNETREISNVTNEVMEQIIPLDVADLVRLHRLIRERMSFTVLEFGVGFSTVIIADALKKNKEDWEALENAPSIRNRFPFQCFSVDTEKKWIEKTKEKIPVHLRASVQFQLSAVEIGTFNGQLCHYYKNLPDIVPDFIYLDGPDPKAVQGDINGMTFQCNERTVMSGDILLMEPILIPGTLILIDGRTNNARFLTNNLKREYKINWDRKGDVTTIELTEERLGKYNILGSDFFKKKA